MFKERKIAFLFPGQGEQYVGMGKEFYDNYPVAKRVFEQADDILQTNLSEMIFSSSIEILTKTIHCQPAIFTVSMATLRVIQEQFPDLIADFCAGLSLGEYSALCASGLLDFENTLRLLDKRAHFIHEATLTTKGGMAAILGLTADEADAIITLIQEGGIKVWVANYNSPGQIVISGEKDDIESALSIFKEKGAKRALPLQVAGGFHSPLMKEAQEKLSPFIDRILLLKANSLLVMNINGKIVRDTIDIKQNLKKQVSGSVCWQHSIETMDEEKTDLYIEIGPGRVLTNLNKRIKPSGTTTNVDKNADLETLAAFLQDL